MQKVYLLLRHNEQKGPFTIDELLQQHLTSSDLVWIEGVSSAWCYPSEIYELNTKALEENIRKKPALISEKIELKNKPQDVKKRLGDDIETRADEIRKNALSHKPVYHHFSPKTLQPAQSFTPVLSPKDEIELVFHKKNRDLVAAPFILSALILVSFALSWYKGWLPNRIKPASSDVVAIPYYPEVQQTSTVGTTEEQAIIYPTQPVLAEETLPVENKIKKTEKQPAVKLAIVPAVKLQTVTTAPNTQEVLAPPLETPALQQEEPITEAISSDAPVTESTEKKKTLGQALKGLFKKKKKEQEN